MLFMDLSLRQVLLQSEEELLAKQTSELASEKAAPKPKKIIGKMKVQGSTLCYLFNTHDLSVSSRTVLN